MVHLLVFSSIIYHNARCGTYTTTVGNREKENIESFLFNGANRMSFSSRFGDINILFLHIYHPNKLLI
jgi:hypothetical protein